MSYDISIIKSCTCGEHSENIYEQSYTFNVRPMYVLAFNSELGIKILNELSPQMAMVFLCNAIDYMNQNSEELTKLNPLNGWGNFEGARDVLINLHHECMKCDNQNYKIEIGW